jgi:hypothetical protein
MRGLLADEGVFVRSEFEKGLCTCGEMMSRDNGGSAATAGTAFITIAQLMACYVAE